MRALSGLRRGVRTQRALSTLSLENMFPVVDEMRLRQYDPRRPHVIFLEGLPGVGKRDVLSRLAKIGFTTYRRTYTDTLLANPDVRPGSALMSQLWLQEQLVWLDALYARTAAGDAVPGNAVFVHRSPLSYDSARTLTVALRDFGCALTSDLRARYQVSVVECTADPVRCAERVAERDFHAADAERSALAALPQGDVVDQARTLVYHRLRAAGEFALRVDTTSSKQAVGALLSHAGIPFTSLWQDLGLRRSDGDV